MDNGKAVALRQEGAPGMDYGNAAQSIKAVTQGKPKIPAKWKRVLRALLSGRRWHRFEAARELSDSCLHSTVATLQSKGVRISRRDITIPGFQGIPTHVCQYWIDTADPENVARALALVEGA